MLERQRYIRYISMKNYLEMPPSKRHNPDYIQLNTDVKKDIGLRFKATCTMKQISLGTGLEQAIKLWLDQEDNQQDKAS